MSPLVSIVVPVFNAENFLFETIESVLNQSYKNWELLLVDDGSTDNSAELCKDFSQKDSRIHYYFKHNGGQASARNLGIKHSTGEWIGFLDSDDLWTPNKLSDQIAEIEIHQPDFSYGLGYYFYPEKTKKLEAYNWITGSRTGLDFFETLYHSCLVNTNTVLVKKSVLERVGQFNEAEIMRGTEDWDLWMRIALSTEKIYGSDKRNVYYRIHEGGIHLQHVRMLRGKIAIYKQYDSNPEVPRLLRLKQYRYVYRELMNYLYSEGRTEEIKLEFKAFCKKDRWGFGTLKQRVLIHILPIKLFMWMSQKVVYRIAYRLETITYKLFLRLNKNG